MTLSERTVADVSNHRLGGFPAQVGAVRSLNDIREPRALSQQAQDLRDRAAMIALLRDQARLGIRYVA